MFAVINLALPVFAVIGAGMIGGRFGFMNTTDSQSLNKFVFRFAMPAALFGLTATTPPPGVEDIALALSYGIAGLAAIFGGYILARMCFPITREEAGAHGFTSTIGNAVFIGLPIALTIDGWARPFVVLMLVEGIVMIGIGAALMSPREGKTSLQTRIFQTVTNPLRNPLVAAALGGFLLSTSGVTLPVSIERFFDILGRAAGPTALFSLGLFLSTHKFPKFSIVAGRVMSIAVVKMAVLPFLTLGIAYLLGVDDPDYVGALALFVFVPSAVGSFVMASQYGVYVTETAAAISFTTLISILTVSGVLIFFT